MLIPDGRVISMGGGHNDFTWKRLQEGDGAEYLEPQYSDNANAPRPTITNLPGDLPYNGSIQVSVGGDTDVVRFTLVRLGSTTHGFDMSQRFIELEFSDSSPMFTVQGPKNRDEAPFHLAQNIAPPGYYMLFAIAASGQPSVGRYIKVGPNLPAMYTCEPSLGFSAVKTVCADEPQGGNCTGTSTPIIVAPPTTVGPSGAPVPGFSVVAETTAVHDAFNARPEELDTVSAMCASACTAHYAGTGIVANCSDSGVFLAPVRVGQGTRALHAVRPQDRYAVGIFGTDKLTCELGRDCYLDFDELLAPAVARRDTQIDAPLRTGEETRVALTGTLAVTGGASVDVIPVSGAAGHSTCTAGHQQTPCPYFLGSFGVGNSGASKHKVLCSDGSTETITVSNLQLQLSQPAFGIAAAGYGVSKGFPPGALVFDASFVDGSGTLIEARRVNPTTVILNAEDGQFDATIPMAMDVPCNGVTGVLSGQLTVAANGVLGTAPQVAVTTPSTVTCGATVALAATVTDADNDVQTVTWTVDGIAMDPAVTSMKVTEGHTLTVVATDSRGATTTASKGIVCN